MSALHRLANPAPHLRDCRPDLSGLDDGPPIKAPRKPAPFKTPEQQAETRAKAWATRRATYGERGHQ